VRLMANRDLDDHFPKRRQIPGPELLRVDRLGRRGVLQDISFSLHAGEVIGIAGLLGAGRSELARVLAGADRSDAGRIVCGGRSVRFRTPADAIRNGIGLLPEDRKADGLVAELTVARNLTLPHGRRLSRTGFLPRRCEEQLAQPLVNDLRVKATPTQQVRLLSGGNQQKVVLGKWLAGDVRVFIFDEPTRGVDVGAKAEIHRLISELAQQGLGILMISSELPEVLGMSDRILVMRGGRLVAEFSREEANQDNVGAAMMRVEAFAAVSTTSIVP